MKKNNDSRINLNTPFILTSHFIFYIIKDFLKTSIILGLPSISISEGFFHQGDTICNDPFTFIIFHQDSHFLNVPVEIVKTNRDLLHFHLHICFRSLNVIQLVTKRIKAKEICHWNHLFCLDIFTENDVFISQPVEDDGERVGGGVDLVNTLEGMAVYFNTDEGQM